MELNFSLTLTEELYRELIDGCRDCNCSPKQFAAESLESTLASRRLPKVEAGRCGPRFGAPTEREIELEDGYRVRWPEEIG